MATQKINPEVAKQATRESELGEAEIRFLGDMERLSLKPGDVLVISSPHELTRESLEGIEAEVGGHFPGHKCCVLAPGLRLGIVEPEHD